MNISPRYLITGILSVFSLIGGIYIGFKICDARQFAVDTHVFVQQSIKLDLARRESTPEGYEEALKMYQAYLDTRKGEWNLLFDERTYAIDSALTYARLANLAEDTGADLKRSSYQKKAASYCPMTKFRDCSAITLREMATRLDKKPLLHDSQE